MDFGHVGHAVFECPLTIAAETAPFPSRTGGPVAEDPRHPTGNRFTGERFEKALNITLNSVVLRSVGQDLTTAGTCIEMTSRILQPALLTLADIAVRERVRL